MFSFQLIIAWLHLSYQARPRLGTAVKPHNMLPITKTSKRESKETELKNVTE